MRTAMTNRKGNDNSPLVLSAGPNPLPALGVEVCAIGLAGWRYIGQVIARDPAHYTYTIRVKSAANPIADRVRQLMQKGV